MIAAWWGRSVAGLLALLLQAAPRDPFLLEAQGQFLFEGGRLGPAVRSYGQAVRQAPDVALIRVALARALIETGARPTLVGDDTLALRKIAIAEARLPAGDPARAHGADLRRLVERRAGTR